MVRTFLFFLLLDFGCFFVSFFTMLWSVKSMQLNYIKKEILST